MSDRKRFTTWQLARMADVSDPRRHDGIGFDDSVLVGTVDPSHGALFLRIVEDTFHEWVEEVGAEDTAHEADWSDWIEGCAPVYTYHLWETFVDLGAWAEVAELAADFGMIEDGNVDMLPTLALLRGAERLFEALADHFGILDPAHAESVR